MISPLFLYTFATKHAEPVLKALLHSRLKKGKESGHRLNERMGIPQKTRPAGPLIWVHAASVGEAQSALILIDSIGRKNPANHVLVTTGTVTSAKLMEQRLPHFAFHQFVPLDHPVWVSRFLNHWDPDMVIWMESELWPNILGAIRIKKIPTILLNARLSDSSYGVWKILRGTAKDILSTFSLILTQTKTDKERFTKLGAMNVIVTDNIKYSAAPLPYDSIALETLRLVIGGRKLWVYASSHAGEEALACRVHKQLKDTFPDLLTIIVPRHPERRMEIAKTCFENGMKFRLRGEHTALPAPDDDVYIADTLGELGLFYTLCPIAMIGRSFSDDGGGGHNPVEAAQCGAVVVTGPNNQFQKQIYDDMRDAGCVVQVMNEKSLYSSLKNCMEDPHGMDSLRQKTADFIRKKTHVVDDVMKNLSPYLEKIGNKHAA